MKNDLNDILDECIDRINQGESVEACLNDYPKYREELYPLLYTMRDTKAVYSFTPSQQAKNMYRHHFNTALVASRERFLRKGSACIGRVNLPTCAGALTLILPER